MFFQQKKYSLPVILVSSYLVPPLFLNYCQPCKKFMNASIVTHPLIWEVLFLISLKDFDKVWHEGLIFKLEIHDIDCKLLKLLENYRTNCQQKVVLNGQTSSWQNIYAGVPQSSVLGLLLFLIYVNDLLNGLTSLCKIFAEDPSLFSKKNERSNPNSQLNSDLGKISKWAFQYVLQSWSKQASYGTVLVQ